MPQTRSPEEKPESHESKNTITGPDLKEMIGDVRLKDAPLLAGWLMLANQIATQSPTKAPSSGESGLNTLREAASKIRGRGAIEVMEMVLDSLSEPAMDIDAVCATTREAIALLRDFSPRDDDVSVLNWMTGEWLRFYQAERSETTKARNPRRPRR